MKKRLLRYFTGLMATLAFALFLKLAIILFVVITLRDHEDCWAISMQVVFRGSLSGGRLEAACLIGYLLAIAVSKSHQCPGYFKPKYQEWLKTSPWLIGMPLPWGDFRIGFAELVILLGIEVLLMFYVDWPFGIAIYLFAICYFGSLHLLSFSAANPWREFFASGFLLALPLVFIDYFAWIVCPVFVLCWALSCSAEKRSWTYWVGLDESSLNETVTEGKHHQVGWPWGEVGEVKEVWPSPHPFLLSALVSVWIYALGHHWPEDEAAVPQGD